MLAARNVYLLTSFTWGMLFWMMATVFMVYQVQVVGLDALQLVLVGTALELGAFLFEVPTGVIADTWSRRLSVVIGYLLTGLAFLGMGLLPDFHALIVASFIWGIGWTFISGAHQAWLADEIGESAAAGTYLRATRIQNVGAFLGILLAVLIGRFELHYPIVAAGALFMVYGVVLRLVMPETGFTPKSGSDNPGMLTTLGEGISVIRGSATLMLLVLVGVVVGAFSEGYDRLSAAHLLRNLQLVEATGFKAVDVFGAMTASSILLAIGLMALAENRINTDSTRHLSGALSLVTLTIIVGVLLFALTGHVWLAIALYIILHPLRQLTAPLTMAWFNRNIPSSSRATVISMHSQADALGQIGGGPAVGLVGRELGVRTAISCAGLLLLPAVWLYSRGGRLKTDQVEITKD